MGVEAGYTMVAHHLVTQRHQGGQMTLPLGVAAPEMLSAN
jgi:hypothetical protein